MPQRITIRPLLWTPGTVASPPKTTPMPTCPRTPSTTASPRPAPPSATVRRVRQNTWTPSGHRSTCPTPARTTWILPPLQRPPVISIRGGQTVTSAIVNGSYGNSEHGTHICFSAAPNDNSKYPTHWQNVTSPACTSPFSIFRGSRGINRKSSDLITVSLLFYVLTVNISVGNVQLCYFSM